jgi:hypothetical protein
LASAVAPPTKTRPVPRPVLKPLRMRSSSGFLRYNPVALSTVLCRRRNVLEQAENVGIEYLDIDVELPGVGEDDMLGRNQQ